MSHITVQLAVKDRQAVAVAIPAEQVISTILVTGSNASLPTLTSVERIIAGSALSGSRWLNQI